MDADVLNKAEVRRKKWQARKEEGRRKKEETEKRLNRS
jgi:hypothetical protein